MATRMQQRRGTSLQWSSANPILAPGEIGFESDTNQFKIGDGINHWDTLSYFKNMESLGGSLDDYIPLTQKGAALGVAELDENGKIPESQIPASVGFDAEITTAVNNAVTALVDGAPTALNTLNELSAAMNDDASFAVTVITAIDVVQTDIDGHKDASTGVHGAGGSVVGTIGPQTLKDKTISGADNTITNILKESVVDLETDLSNITSDIFALQTDNDASKVTILSHTDSISTIEGDIVGLNGVTDGLLDAIALKAEINSPTFTGTVSGITKSMVGLGSVDDTSDADKPVSTATQTALNTHASDTTNIHGIADTAELVTKTGTETLSHKTINDATFNVTVGLLPVQIDLSVLSGATSNIQNQLDTKATPSDISDHSSDTTNVHGIADTSALATKTYADNVAAAVTKTTLGLDNVDNTSDANKPVSTATQTELDLKAPKASPTFTGTATAEDLTVTGNLTVSGTTTTVNATDLEISDPLIYIGTGNSANVNDLGIVGHFDDGTYQHTGIVRDATDGKWKLFSGVTTEPSGTIDFSSYTKDALVLGALEATSATIGNVSNTELQYLDGVTSAIQTQLNAKTPELYTFTTVSGTAKTIATADIFKSFRCTASGAVTITVPTNASDAIPVGAYFELYQWGGQITVVAETPATTAIRSTDSQTKSRTTYSSMVLMKVDTDEWLLTGDLTA